MRFPRALPCALVVVCFALASLASCAGDDAPARDAAAAPPDAEVDSGLPRCCPLDLVPGTTCGCVRIGGATPSDGRCPERCAVSQSDFSVAADDLGCLFNTIPANSVCEVPDGG